MYVDNKIHIPAHMVHIKTKLPSLHANFNVLVTAALSSISWHRCVLVFLIRDPGSYLVGMENSSLYFV